MKLARENTGLYLLTQKQELNLMHISTSLHTQRATQCAKKGYISVV